MLKVNVWLEKSDYKWLNAYARLHTQECSKNWSRKSFKRELIDKHHIYNIARESRTILKYVTYQITLNTNLGNIDHRKIKLLPLDSFHQGDFNEPNFIKSNHRLS